MPGSYRIFLRVFFAAQTPPRRLNRYLLGTEPNFPGLSGVRRLDLYYTSYMRLSSHCRVATLWASGLQTSPKRAAGTFKALPGRMRKGAGELQCRSPIHLGGFLGPKAANEVPSKACI